jgi:3-hydroxypropanoate dehydrogenase
VTSGIDERVQDLLFRKARTHHGWKDQRIDDRTLRELYDLLKWGPTSLNSAPARFLFVRSPAAKERLRPALSRSNVEQTMAAPVTVIVAHDLVFHQHLPRLFPANPAASSWFENAPEFAATNALRNGALQGAYLIIAARGLGLDCGPMSGFNHEILDATFFPDQPWRSNFLCNLGYGDPAKVYPRGPRLDFEESCSVL